MAFSLVGIASLLGISISVLILAVVWSFVWKGLALWKAARKNSKIWFIILLIVNTLGILEILYIFVFSELGRRERAVSIRARPARRRRR